MTVAVAITPTSGNITAKKTVCRINVTGAPENTLTGYDHTKYPASPALVYYLFVDSPAGVDDAKSYRFSPASDGTHAFVNYIFPAAGSYTLRLRNAGDDSDAATLAVTVS